MRLAIAALLVPALAFAGPKFITTVKVALDTENAAVTTAIEGVKLDACWRTAATAKIRVVYETGKATTIEILENADAKAAACIKKAFKAVKIKDAPAKVVATVELESRKFDIDELAKSGMVGAKLESGGGGRPADEIDRVIKASAREIRNCYQKELNRTPNIGGKLVVQFKIATDGTVKTAKKVSSTVGSTVVDDCVIREVKRLKFPASEAEAVVNYPFIFAKG